MTISRFINNLMLCLILLAFSTQLAIDFSTTNILCASLALVSGMTIVLYLRFSAALDTHPLSSLSLLGFSVTTQWGAMLAQSALWTSLVFNLRQPEATFSTLLMYQTVALVAHVVYRKMASPKTTITPIRENSEGDQKLSIFSVPNVAQVWIMGMIGTLFLMLTAFIPSAGGISFLAWMPFLIPVYASHQKQQYCNTRLHYPILFLHFLVIALISMAVNTRQIMLSGFMTIGLLFLLIGMKNDSPIKSSQIIKFGALGIFALALAWPLTDLMTAMVIAREDRYRIPMVKVVERTLENVQKPELLESYRRKQFQSSFFLAYDENYLSNPLLARLFETKFQDNSLYFASRISSRGGEDIRKVTIELLWGTLPQPVLDWMKVDVNKQKLYFSMGDQLALYATGEPLGGYKVGSALAHGIVLFGDIFPLVYFVICCLIYKVYDMLSIRTEVGVTLISAVGMLKIWPLFLYGITADNLTVLFGNVFRVILQSVLAYLAVLYIAKILTPKFSNLVLPRPHI